MTDPKTDLNPLTAFFHAVMDELRKRLDPEGYAELLRKCNES